MASYGDSVGYLGPHTVRSHFLPPVRDPSSPYNSLSPFPVRSKDSKGSKAAASPDAALVLVFLNQTTSLKRVSLS